MTQRHRLALALLALVAGGPAAAQTLYDQGPPQSRIVHRSLVALRYNPIGFVYDGRIGYRHRLFLSDSLAMRDNFVGGGLAANLSPAFLRIGPYLEVAPMSMVTFYASFQLVSHFGNFDLLQSFPSPLSEFSDDLLEEREDEYGALGSELTFGVDLQAKAGPVVLRSRARFVLGNMDLRTGDRVYYDRLYDVLAPDGGWFFTNDLDVLYVSPDRHIAAGLRYTATLPLYGTRHYVLGEPEEHDNSMHRLGPLLSYTFFTRDGAAFNSPSVFLLVQWWLDHRYRTGQETSQGLPLVGLGFQFYGDLLPF